MITYNSWRFDEISEEEIREKGSIGNWGYSSIPLTPNGPCVGPAYTGFTYFEIRDRLFRDQRYGKTNPSDWQLFRFDFESESQEGRIEEWREYLYKTMNEYPGEEAKAKTIEEIISYQRELLNSGG